MKTNLIAWTLLPFLLFDIKSVGQPPEATISNEIIKARLYLPDRETGYYRGSRFDWSGVLPELEYQGHSYFGQWFEKYSPTLHDAIMGPVDDFYPVGYEEAKTGEHFLKIGIGIVVKPDEPRYSIVTPYEIVNPGTWKVKAKSDRVVFTQTLKDEAYSYLYEKTVRLVKGKPELILAHSLKNTGGNPIETNVYNHNFFVMDGQPTGRDFTITFPFVPTGEPNGPEAPGRLEGTQIRFLKELEMGDHLYYGAIQGFGSSASDYDIRIENHKTGAGVHITSDRPLSKLVFWSALKTVCPEPYTHISIQPGETFTWTLFYQFYVSPAR